MSPNNRSSYEEWTWERCSQRILSLKGRLGYQEEIWILGFELMDDGCLRDPFHGVEVFDPQKGVAANQIPSQFNAVPEMYCILSLYAASDECSLSGEQISLASLDPVWRSGLSSRDCTTLLKYGEQDFSALRAGEVPFFGENLDGGDLSFDVWPLPRVVVRFVLWRGDEDVTDGGTLLFDKTVTHFVKGLEMELAWLTIWRLKNILNLDVKWGYHQLSSSD